KVYLEKLIRRQPYQLSPETEKIIAAFTAVFAGPSELYDITKMGDMQCPNLTVENKTYPLSYVSFEGEWEVEVTTKKRHTACDTFYNTMRQYQHTTAKTYDVPLLQEKTESDTRGFENVRES